MMELAINALKKKTMSSYDAESVGVPMCTNFVMMMMIKIKKKIDLLTKF